MPRLWPISWAMVLATPMGFGLWSYRRGHVGWGHSGGQSPARPQQAEGLGGASCQHHFFKPKASVHPSEEAAAQVSGGQHRDQQVDLSPEVPPHRPQLKLRSPLPAPHPPWPAPASVQQTQLDPPHLVHSPRVLGAHGGHLGQSHGGPCEVDPAGKESSVCMWTPRNPPPLGAPSSRRQRGPPPTHVMNCALSCRCRPARSCTRQDRKLLSVVSAWVLTSILSPPFHISRPTSTTRKLSS